MTSVLLPTISPWHDIVFHTLACVPVDGRDYSSLYDPTYAQWIQRYWPKGFAAIWGLLDKLGAAYNRSRKSFLLQGFPNLWTDLGSFIADRERDFDQMRWPDASRDSLAMLICTELDPDVVHLFRMAILAQAEAGFLDHWHTTVEPRARAFADQFAGQMSALALELPGLQRVRWALTHPLRTCGRLMDIKEPGPQICVGVADPELDVSDMHPVIQGCHEYFLSLLPAERISVNQIATCPDIEGFEQFEVAESQALSQGRAFFGESPWKTAYYEWLALAATSTDPDAGASAH